MQSIENQLAYRFKGGEYAQTLGGDSFKTWYAAGIQFSFQTLNRQCISQISLVVLKNPGNVVEGEAVLLQVVNHILQRFDVVARTHDIRVGDEDNAVDAVQNELSAGVVFNLTRDRIKRESSLETLHAA